MSHFSINILNIFLLIILLCVSFFKLLSNIAASLFSLDVLPGTLIDWVCDLSEEVLSSGTFAVKVNKMSSCLKFTKYVQSVI